MVGCCVGCILACRGGRRAIGALSGWIRSGSTLGAAGVFTGIFIGRIRVGCTLGGARTGGADTGMIFGCTLGGSRTCDAADGSIGCIAWKGTLGAACAVLSVVFVAPVVCKKISANCRSADICSPAIRSNGAAGCGLRSVVVSCAAASHAASADVVVGMSYRYGKNSTVRAMRSALVFGM